MGATRISFAIDAQALIGRGGRIRMILLTGKLLVAASSKLRKAITRILRRCVPGHRHASGEFLEGLFGSRRHLVLPLALVGLMTTIFARLMSYEVRRDEHLYVPPASLLETQSLYFDFFYNHVPNSAYWFYLVKYFTGTNSLLFAARLAVYFGWLALAVGLVVISFQITRSVAMTFFLSLLVLTNTELLSVTGMTATNNFLPLPLVYLGLGLFTLAMLDSSARPILVFFAGLLLSLGAGMKVSAVSFVLPVAVAAVLLPRGMTLALRFKQVTLPLAIGGLLGALPVLIHLVRQPELFLAHVVGFHMGPHVAYWKEFQGVTSDVAMVLPEKLRLMHLIWASGANAILLYVALFLLLLISRYGRWPFVVSAPVAAPLLVVTSTFILTFLFSFLPTPSFPQYFTPPLICVPLALALLYRVLDVKQKRNVRLLAAAASVALVVISLPRLTQNLANVLYFGEWTSTKTHRYGTAIARSLAAEGVTGRVATLAPIYPLEGGLEVYPELATGQFAYRTAKFTSGYLSKYYRSTSPYAIEKLFDGDPPAAILVGFDKRLELPMIRFAIAKGYKRLTSVKFQDRYGKAVLYVRSDRSP